MISWPARALYKNFLIQNGPPEAKKLPCRSKIVLFGTRITKKVFLINDQLAGPSSIRKPFGSKKPF